MNCVGKAAASPDLQLPAVPPCPWSPFLSDAAEICVVAEISVAEICSPAFLPLPRCLPSPGPPCLQSLRSEAVEGSFLGGTASRSIYSPHSVPLRSSHSPNRSLYPPCLQSLLSEAVEEFISGGTAPAELQIRNLVACELAYINTSHPQFIGGNRAIAHVRALRERRVGEGRGAGGRLLVGVAPERGQWERGTQPAGDTRCCCCRRRRPVAFHSTGNPAQRVLVRLAGA